MKEQLLALIDRLEKRHDFDSEFYLIYTGQMDDGDISDWDSGNFDDSVSLGFSAGQTDTAAEIITELQKIIKGEIK